MFSDQVKMVLIRIDQPRCHLDLEDSGKRSFVKEDIKTKKCSKS